MPSPTPPHPQSEPPSIDWRRIHLWQIQPVRDLLLLALVVLLVWLGYQARLVTVPLLIALLMAYLFEPLARVLTKRGWFSRKGAAAGIIALVAVAVIVPLILGVGFAVVQGVGFAGNLSRDIRLVLASAEKPEEARLRERIQGEGWRHIRDWLVEHKQPEKSGSSPPPPEEPSSATTPPAAHDPPPRTSSPTTDSGAATNSNANESSPVRLLTTLMNWIEQNAAGVASTVGKSAVGSGAQALGVVLATFASIGQFLFMLFLTMFFFFFLSTGWGRVLAWAEKFIPHAGKYRWMRIINRMDRAIAGFVRGRLTICAIVSVYMTIAFWFVGVPAPFLLGPMVGVMFLVPFVPLVAVPVVMLLLWLNSNAVGFRAEWWWIVFAPIGCHIGGQVMDDYILTPRIQGDNTDMEMPAILFASLAGGALAGVYGLLLAIPVAACLKILAKEFLWPRVEKWVKGEAVDPLPIAGE